MNPDWYRCTGTSIPLKSQRHAMSDDPQSILEPFSSRHRDSRRASARALRHHRARLRGDITGQEHRPNPQFSVEPVGQGPPTDACFWGHGWLSTLGARLLRLCLPRR
ncbi:hypothetical protein CORC01_08997 [Colletotrichum orchidophilum]|uniref:Uncharacterized protein n=1 Tax=Colletotrichum orchidophilum TaxID=1209926 RepID=A0A1G4B2Z9_9PEZI|nr:uncharacterized protein CORC01_08997 [Colletotrichum orchidophilum]OHE95713.1 hypothetical protein CORC01_08997 [Colletotrichum orchidophilum]